MSLKSNTQPSERSAETRQRILDAALREFAANGLAGARTETIASAAGVNKALIYYYFTSKETLYSSALEMIAERVRDNTMAIFTRDCSPGERVLRSAIAHFDRILAQQEFQSLLQQEMVRVHKGETAILPILIKRVFEPAMIMFRSMVREGIASGELVQTDWQQIQLASVGGNVMYFLSAPVWRLVMDREPLSHEALAERRKLLLEFLGLAIFQDRTYGASLAAKVLADTPMPEVTLPNLPTSGTLGARVLQEAPRPDFWKKDAKEKTK